MPRGIYHRIPKNTPLERFEAKYIPEPNTGCWLWIGALNPRYGKLLIRRNIEYAHRFAYEHYKGRILPGLEIDHVCEMECCVNPFHLEAVTNDENMKRAMLRRQARQHACPKGHPVNDVNSHLRSNGHRQCRECDRIYHRQNSHA